MANVAFGGLYLYINARIALFSNCGMTMYCVVIFVEFKPLGVNVFSLLIHLVSANCLCLVFHVVLCCRM